MRNVRRPSASDITMTKSHETTRGSVGRWASSSTALLVALVVVLGVVGELVESPFLLSLSVGFLLGLVNLWLMARLLGVLVFGGSSRLASLCGMGLTLKLAGLVGAVYALVAADLAEPLPLVLGCAASPLVHAFKRAAADYSSKSSALSTLS
jgi:hypothetical protein